MLHGKRDFTDVTKDLGTSLDCAGGPNPMTQDLKSGEPFLAVLRERRDDGRRVTQIPRRWL